MTGRKSGDRRPPRAPADAGMTIVELILYGAISALVSAVVAGVFVSGLQSEGGTRDRDAATGSAQLVSTSVQTAIRNSSTFNVTGAKLTAKVAKGTGTEWECQSWKLTGAGELLFKRSPGAIPFTDNSSWVTLATGASGTVIPDRPFEQDGTRLILRLQVQVGAETARVSTATNAEALGTGGIPCW